MLRSFVLASVVFLSAASAWSLDLGDVLVLLDNQVPESVIINMVAQQGDLALSESDANELRQAGASENLINALGIGDSYVQADGNLAPAWSSAPIVTDERQFAPPPVVVGNAATPPAMPAAASGPPQGSPIMPLAVAASGSAPLLGTREGWLSISNRDWQPYFLLVNPSDKRMFISRFENGGTIINPGENVVLNVRRETYKLFGDTGKSLQVRIRDNLTTTLSLDPFGVVGNSGLMGVSTDRDRVRNEVLFNAFVPPAQVVVMPPQVVYEHPAPVIVAPPPSVQFYYGHGRPSRHHGGRYWR